MKCQAAFEDWFVLRTDLNLQITQCCPHEGKKHLAVQKSNSSNVSAIHYSFQNALLQDINRGWISFSTTRGRRIWICWTCFQINQMKMLFLDGWYLLFMATMSRKTNPTEIPTNLSTFFLFQYYCSVKFYSKALNPGGTVILFVPRYVGCLWMEELKKAGLVNRLTDIIFYSLISCME